MPNVLLSVVLCSYNRADSLALALATVVAQRPSEAFGVEVVVVDDGSTDHTRETVEQIAASAPMAVRHVFESSRRGVATARNRGIAEAQGNYVVFFDDDQLAEQDWLVELFAVVQAQGAKIVGGARRLDLSDDVLRGLGPNCRGVLGENLYEDPPARMIGKDLPTTGNLLVAREVFDRVGTFDEALSAGEDAEFLGRSRNAGIEIWTAPRAMVAHMIPQHRQEARYFRWVSLRWGSQFARIDAKRRGRAGLLLLALARLAQAALVHAPRLLMARVRGDAASALDLQCLLWRAWGYLRTTAHLCAPMAFPQRDFFEFIEFRGERALFADNTAAAATR